MGITNVYEKTEAQMTTKEKLERDKGLVLHLDFSTPYSADNLILDKSGNNNHATVVPSTAPVWIENGMIGKGAYSFDGSNDYVRVDNNIITSPTQLTMSAWFNKQGEGSNYECVIHRGPDNSIGGTEFWLGVSANDFLTATIGARAGVGWSAGETTVKVVLNRWYHLAATWDGTTVRVYIDGELNKSYALASYSNANSPTRLGASNDGTAYQYNGLVDDVRIYSTALSAKDVKELYQTRATLDEGGNLSVMGVNSEDPFYRGNAPIVLDNTNKNNGSWRQSGVGSYGLDLGDHTGKIIAGHKYYGRATVKYTTIGDTPTSLSLYQAQGYIGSASKPTPIADTEYVLSGITNVPSNFAYLNNNNLKIYAIPSSAISGVITYGKKGINVDLTESGLLPYLERIGITSDAAIKTWCDTYIPFFEDTFEIGGSIENMLYNADFSNGTTGWSIYNSTETIVSNGSASLSQGAATNGQVRFVQSVPNIYKNHKYYMSSVVEILGDFTASYNHRHEVYSGTINGEPNSTLNRKTFYEMGNGEYTLGEVYKEGGIQDFSYDGVGQQLFFAYSINISEMSTRPIKFKLSKPIFMDLSSNGLYSFMSLLGMGENNMNSWITENIPFFTGEKALNQFIRYGNITGSNLIQNSVEITTNGLLDSTRFSEVGITDGLVAWYPLDGNARDYTMNRNDGTVNGASVAEGLGQSCYSFDGADSIIINKSISNNMPQAVTISAWVKYDANNDNQYHDVVGAGLSYGGTCTLFLGMYNNTTIMGEVRGPDGRVNLASSAPVGNVWRFLAYTVDTTSRVLYLDGTPVSTGTGSSLVNVDADLKIGGMRTTDFLRLIQDVRIYNRALDPKEIKILYDLTKNTKTSFTEDGKVFIPGQLKEVY